MTQSSDRPRRFGLIRRATRRVTDADDHTALVPAAPSPSSEPDSPSEPAQTPVPQEAPEINPTPETPASFERTFASRNLPVKETGASQVLCDRLDALDLAEIELQISQSPDLQADYAANSDPATRRHMILAFGIWLGVPSVLEKTGLMGTQPPEDVHAMARGPLAAAGGLYEADLVVDALANAGVEIAEVDSALDFGCSSGRVLRVLAAAYPEIDWHGCDPNAPAIAWASENLPGMDFSVNGDTPPLRLDDGALDLVYAISIWSHFAPELGLCWFEEMRRLLRPGGHLVCTTHGLTAIAYYATRDLRTPEQSDEIRDALYCEGSWYAPEFGEEGDWGVVNPNWGTAFLSPEWMLTRLCPHWRFVEFASGRNQDNQDVYVLQRV